MGKILIAIGIVLIVAAAGWGLHIAFSNPDMTETRLLLTFWREELAQSAMMIAGLILLRAGMVKDRR